MKVSKLLLVAGLLGTTPLLPALAVAQPPQAQAQAPSAEQIYFAATIAKGGALVSRPQALVRVGARAELRLRTNAGGPRFGLRYVVDQPANADMTATVTGLVDGQEVATGILHFTGEKTAALTLDGGGYTWQVDAAPMSRESMSRRRSSPRP
jgi:hypothetical protein